MEDIEVTMTEVRKAYRLLAVYQQNVLKVVQDIAKEFDYEFYRWEPNHDVATDEKSPPFRLGGWGMLPMYDISFLFLNPTYDRRNPQPGEWLLEVNVFTDNGYEEKKDKILSPLEFKDGVDESDTQIGLFAMQLTTENKPRQYWYDIWNDDSDYPDDAEDVIKNENYKLIGDWYNTSKLLANEDSFQGVIADFKGILAQHGIQT